MPRRVMVVEDNPITRKMLRVVLATEGYSVVEASDAKSALECMRQEPPDLILQDLVLPDMDGVDLVRALRALPGGEEVPILVLSGFVTRLDEVRAMEGTFSGYLVKPVEPATLTQTMREYLPADDLTARNVGLGRSVLVVDDDLVELKMTSLHLTQCGFSVTASTSSRACLATASEHPHDAIVAEALMPELDGFELCLNLRREPRLAATPIVLLASHHLESADRELARQVGANHVVSRAAGLNELVAALQQSLEVGARVAPLPSIDMLPRDRAISAVRQLERQTRLNALLAQRSGMLGLQLAVLSRVIEVLGQSGDTDATLQEVLEVCLDTAGISKGALFLLDPSGTARVQHAIGYSAPQREVLDGCFDDTPTFERISSSGMPIAIPSSGLDPEVSRDLLSRAGLSGATLVPIMSGSHVMGALLLGSKSLDIAEAEHLSFLRMLAAQIGQAVALTSAFKSIASSEQRFSTIFRACPVPIAMATVEGGRFVEINERYAELVGHARDELIGRSIVEVGLLTDPDEPKRMRQILKRDGAVRNVAGKMRRKSGEILDVQLTMEYLDLPGEPMLLAMPLDVTESKRSEAERATQFAVTRVLSESITMDEAAPRLLQAICETHDWQVGVMWRVDPDANVLLCGHVWHRSGAEAEEFVAATRRSTFPSGSGLPGAIWQGGKSMWVPDMATETGYPRQAAAARDGIHSGCGFPIVSGGRIVGTFEFFGHQFRDCQPAFLDLMDDLGVRIGHFLERKRADEALAERTRLNALSADVAVALTHGGDLQEALQRCTEAMVHHLDAAFARIWTVDGEQKVLELQASAGMYTHIDGPHSRVPVGQYKIGLIAEERLPHLTNDVLGDPRVGDHEWAKREGMISFAGHPLIVEGQLIGVMAMFARRHLTEFVQRALTTVADGIALGIARRWDQKANVELQAQLMQSQKMEAMGKLAGGVAHDFNNLLTAIVGFGSLALGELDARHPTRHKLEEVIKAGERAASLTRQLLVFSRQHVVQPKILDLNAVVGELDKLLRRIIGEDIELVTRRATDIGQIKADPGQVEQVLVNIAVNARDAMPMGGKLTIETASVELSPAYASDHADVVPGRYSLVSVTDTGHGMDAEILKRIFEPFFTTKGPGKGTGLGLATVYGIVKQANGHIAVESEPGAGTLFKIYFPRVDEPAEAVPSLRPENEMARGTETVLLAEDEDGLRRLACIILGDLGYTVLSAASGPEAVEMAKGHAGPIDLILTDVVMPGMGGRQLCEALTSIRPEARVLYMSGYTDDAVVHHGVFEAGVAFLQKPFVPATLAAKIREVLDGPEPPARLRAAA